MTLEDFGKFINRTLFLSVEAVGGPRLIKFFYFLGLASILVWVINHLFATFGTGFGNGLWGLIEIAAFGLFSVVALRILSEVLIVYFRAHTDEVPAAPKEAELSLIDEMRDAIDELATEEEKAPAPAPKPAAPAAAKPRTARKSTPRTAKRTPAKKSDI